MNTNNLLIMKNLTCNYTIKTASIENAYEIWEIMDYCYNDLEQKEFFICDDLNYVKDVLTQKGFGVIACDPNDKIVGNLLVTYPGIAKENLGYDIFPNYFSKFNPPSQTFLTEELNKVVHMDSATVLPAHRGHHLESRMIEFAEKLIDTSRYSYAFATVAPNNAASLKSLIRNGYQIMDTKEKYCGLLRCILMKHLL